MKKELRIKVKELTRSKYRRLSKFCEKGNEEIDIGSINYSDQTKLTHLWLNLSNGYGNCWLPLDGALTENELERVEKIKILGDHKEHRELLFFKKKPGGLHNNRTMSVASVKFLEKPKYAEIPLEIQKIKRKIPLSKVYEISAGEYAGCYAIKVAGYWSPPLFRTNFDCGIYDEGGKLMSI